MAVGKFERLAAAERGQRQGSPGATARESMRTRVGAPPTKLALDQVQRNPLNPRYSAEDSETKELVATFQTVGQLQPGVVIPVEDYRSAYPDQPIGNEPWVVLIGNRRHFAAELAELPVFDVRVKTGLTSPDDIEDFIVIENSQRVDLPLLKEAELLQRRIERGSSLRDVAKRVGKSHSWVQQRVDLLKLIPELQEALKSGGVNFKTARTLAALSTRDQKARYEAGPPFTLPSRPSGEERSTPPVELPAEEPLTEVETQAQPVTSTDGEESRVLSPVQDAVASADPAELPTPETSVVPVTTGRPEDQPAEEAVTNEPSDSQRIRAIHKDLLTVRRKMSALELSSTLDDDDLAAWTRSARLLDDSIEAVSKITPRTT